MRAPREFKVGEIEAHRYWMLCETGLYSPHTGVEWSDARLEGRWAGMALPDKPRFFRGVHAIKDVDEMYAWLARDDVLQGIRDQWFRSGLWFNPCKPIGLVTGTVRLWGYVEEGRRGYAAQHARVLRLDQINRGPKFAKWEDYHGG